MFDLIAAVGTQRVAHDLVVRVHHLLRLGVAQTLRKLRRSFDVGEQNRIDVGGDRHWRGRGLSLDFDANKTSDCGGDPFVRHPRRGCRVIEGQEL